MSPFHGVFDVIPEGHASSRPHMILVPVVGGVNVLVDTAMYTVSSIRCNHTYIHDHDRRQGTT